MLRLRDDTTSRGRRCESTPQQIFFGPLRFLGSFQTAHGHDRYDRPASILEVKTIYNDSYKKKHFSRFSGDSQSILGDSDGKRGEEVR